MTLTDDQQRLKALLTETVTLLCKNGLHFNSEVAIDGVIGITVDKSNVFLVCIRENVQQLKDTSSDRNLSGSVVRQSLQSDGMLFSAPSTESINPASPVVVNQHHSSYAHYDSAATITETCGNVDFETYNTTTRSEMSFFSSIAAKNQNTNLSTSVLGVTDYMNTSCKTNDSYHETVADNSSHLQHDSNQEKSLQDIDTETVSVENMSPSHKEVVDIKYEATEQAAESLEPDPQSDHSVVDVDAPDMELNAGTADMEFETAPSSFADQQLPFGRISALACTADSNTQNLLRACRNALQLATRNRTRACRDCGVPIYSQCEVESGGCHSGHMIRECFPCPYCSKLFTNTYNLRGHLSQHTGMKEFCCPVCGREHSLKHNFLNHMANVHGIRLERTTPGSMIARCRPQIEPKQSQKVAKRGKLT